ncbi:MAG: polymorphic toxin type 23 domain-containing protein [Cyanobacteria bacterium J06642_11]
MWSFPLLAQLSMAQAFDAGIKAGISYQVGTQTNRIGLTVGTFVRNNDIDTEAFAHWSGYRHFSHIETPEAGWQQEITLGLTQGFGPQRATGDHDWSLAANNTERYNSVSAYTTIYNDTYNTSQRLVGLGLNIGDANLRFENDYDPFELLGDGEDRFRTGALELGYRTNDDVNLVLGFNVFTGDALDGGRDHTIGPNGAYTLTRADGTAVTAADRSTGTIYGGARNLDLEDDADFIGLDNMQLRLGWSSEGIRDTTQNRFHDLIDNSRIPVRDVPGKLYFQFGTNDGQPLYP